jgi:hypothetical protein
MKWGTTETEEKALEEEMPFVVGHLGEKTPSTWMADRMDARDGNAVGPGSATSMEKDHSVQLEEK